MATGTTPVDPTMFEVISSALTYLSSIMIAWLWYIIKRKDKQSDDQKIKVDMIRDEQIRHSERFVDSDDVRSITRDEMAPLKESHNELKMLMAELRANVSGISTAQEVQTQMLRQLSQAIMEIKEDSRNRSGRE